MLDLKAARLASTPVAAVAREHGVAPSTLRDWERRARPGTLSAPVRAFFETPEGLCLLHRIVLAALMVIVAMGGSGVPLVRLFLVWTGLHELVACSDRHLQARMRTLLHTVGAWEGDERARLASSMCPRAIGVCVDETFHGGMLLVAQEPVSGFLLVEKPSARRDGETWKQVLDEGLAGLPVTVAQVTSDEAEGLRALTRKLLGAHHNSDVFHGLHELCRGLFGPLRSRLHVASEAVAQAHRAVERVQAAWASWRATPRSPGRPPDWTTRLDRALTGEGEAASALQVLCDQRAALRAALHDLGETVSPIDLRTGVWLTPTQVRARLQGIFDELWQRVMELGLPERTHASLSKAQRLVDSWVGTVAWWQRQVEARLAAASLSPEVEALVRAVCIPAALLDRARRRAPTALLRRAYGALHEKVTEPLRDASGLWQQQSEAQRAALQRLAWQCAEWFQTSSSGTEGRNGYLSLRHHHLHALPPPWLKLLTVLHNYVIQRPDGTTAAQRFFGAKPADLFEHLVTVMPLPERPRTRKRREPPSSLAAVA